MCQTADLLKKQIHRRLPIITELPEHLQPTFVNWGKLKYIEKATPYLKENDDVMIILYFEKLQYQHKHLTSVITNIQDTHYRLRDLVYAAADKRVIIFLELRKTS